MSHNEALSLEMLRGGTGAGGSRRGRRPTRGAPPEDPRWHRLSESVAKARIELARAKGIVGIPRFFSRPIPARSAFAADLDKSPSQDRPRSPTRPIAGESFGMVPPVAPWDSCPAVPGIRGRPAEP